MLFYRLYRYSQLFSDLFVACALREKREDFSLAGCYPVWHVAFAAHKTPQLTCNGARQCQLLVERPVACRDIETAYEIAI